MVRLAWMAVRGSDVDKEDSTLYMDAPCRSQEESGGPRLLKSTGLHGHLHGWQFDSDIGSINRVTWGIGIS